MSKKLDIGYILVDKNNYLIYEKDDLYESIIKKVN